MWESPPERIELTGDQVHIWRAALDLPTLAVRRLEKELVEEETARARRLYFERDRKRFTVAHALVREVIGRYVGEPSARLLFRRNEYGKPSLLDDAVRFNLSHSGDEALLAITRRPHVGVDIERIRRDIEYLEIAGRYFSESESRELRSLPADLQTAAFFRGWTRKEAFIKAIGEGVSFPLDRFDVSLAPGRLARLVSIRGDPGAAARWDLRDVQVDDCYAAAVVVDGGECDLRFFQWMPPPEP